MQIAPPRSHNADQFSIFLSFPVTPLQWQHDPRLRRNIQLYATHDRQFAQLCDRSDLEGLEQFFQNLALNENLPKQRWEPFNRKQLAFNHLASYYDLTAYNAAKKLSHNYQEISGQEAFLIARESLCNFQNLEKYLKNYRGDNNAKFSTYLQEVLMRKVKDEMSVGKYSRWRRLCQESQNNLAEALELISGAAEITRILWIRKYFKKVYMMNRVMSPMRSRGETWPSPEPEDFEETAKICQAERFLPSTPIEISNYDREITGNQIQQWLAACTKALNQQKKLENNITSLEEIYPIIDDESDQVEIQEIEPSETQIKNSSQDYKLNQVFENQLQQGRGVQQIQLIDRLWLVDRDKVLPLHYGVGFTQKQIAAHLGLNQSSINRKLSNYTRNLLKALNQVSQPESWMSTYISNWLSKHMRSPDYADQLQVGLIELLKQINQSNRALLFLHYGQGLNLFQISQKLKLTESQLTEKLNAIEKQLQDNLCQTLAKLTSQYVKQWLSEYYCSPIYDDLKHKFQGLKSEVKEILILRYDRQLTDAEIMQWLNIEAEQIQDLVIEGLCPLEESLVLWINEYLGVSIQESEQEAIANCVISYLQNGNQQN